MVVTRLAQRGLDKLTGSDFQIVIEAIRGLTDTPRPRGIEKVKATGLWRIRKGNYRIIFAIDDKKQIITVVRVGNRREIYRSL